MRPSANTSTSKNPQPDGTDFYCERFSCWMRYEACIHRQAIAAAQTGGETNNKYRLFARQTPTLMAPEHCQNCPQGKTARQQVALAKKVKTPDATRPSHCRWPGCNKPACAIGLCNTHYQRTRRNTLIRCNTKQSGREALEDLVIDLIRIADSHQLDIEDVTLACLAQGVTCYHKTHSSKGGETTDQINTRQGCN